MAGGSMTILRGMTWDHPRGYGCIVASSAEYARLTGVEIRWEKHPLSAFEAAPIQDLAAAHDLMVLDHPHIPEAARAGALAALDGHGHDRELATLAEQSVGRSHETYAYDGHQYGLATDAAAQVAVYRPDLLSEAPRDWDGVFELAREGRVMWPSNPVHALSTLVTLASNEGMPPTSQPGVFLDEGRIARYGSMTEAVDSYLQTLEHVRSQDLSVRRDRKGVGMARLLGAEVEAIGQPVASFMGRVRGPEDTFDVRSSHAFVCELDELLLLPGRYRLDVAVVGDNALQDFIEAATVFEVSDGQIRGRQVQPDGKFSIGMPHRWILPAKA